MNQFFHRSKFVQSLGEVMHTMAEQTKIPPLNLKRNPPSATMMLIAVSFFAFVFNWFVKLTPLTSFLNQNVKFQIRNVDDILNLLEQKVDDREVRLLSCVSVEEVREILVLSHRTDKNLKGHLDKLLNETEYNVDPNTCFEKAKSYDPKHYYICVGILNVLAHAMELDNSSYNNYDRRLLEIQEIGTMKFCSYVFSQTFPYVEMFNRRISQIVESGISDLWVTRHLSKINRRSIHNHTNSNKNEYKIFNFDIVFGMIIDMINNFCVISIIFMLEHAWRNRDKIINITKIIGVFACNCINKIIQFVKLHFTRNC